MRSLRLLIPLAVFIVIVGFLWAGLGRDPREVPSPLVGKPAPVFDLVQLKQPEEARQQLDLLANAAGDVAFNRDVLRLRLAREEAKSEGSHTAVSPGTQTGAAEDEKKIKSVGYDVFEIAPFRNR
jgi:hypothetical protein